MTLRLSPSAISAWRNCPAEYWRKYLSSDRWPDNRPYFAQGRVVHKMAEIALKNQTRARNAGEVRKDPLIWVTDAIFDREWKREASRVADWKDVKPEKAKEHTYHAARAIVSHVGNWDVEGMEEKFEVPIAEGIVMPGVIDIRGKRRIVDIKTHAEKDTPYTARYASEQFQPSAYALGAWHLTGEMPKEFQYVSVSMKPPYAVVATEPIHLTPFHAMRAVATARIVARAVQSMEFPTRWSGGCKQCPYRSRGVDCLGNAPDHKELS